MRYHHIMAVAVDHRSKHVPNLQSILTHYGCIIKVRLGLHETDSNSCSDDGLILLHLAGEEEEMNKLEKEIKELDGIRVNRMKI